MRLRLRIILSLTGASALVLLAGGPAAASSGTPGPIPDEAIAARIETAERSFRPEELPAKLREQLPGDLATTAPHAFSVWRDVPALNPDGTVNVYVEIERGTLTKWEFSLAENRCKVDRILPDSLGGYPVNYGFVPGTMAWDGDPFDHLLIGAKLPSGVLLRAVILGTMRFVDEKGMDSKVIVAPAAPDGKPLQALDDETRKALERFFNAYKKHDAAKGKFSRVLGFGDAAEGLRYVKATAAFVTEAKTAATATSAAGAR